MEVCVRRQRWQWWQQRRRLYERFCESVPRLIRMSFSAHTQTHTHTRSPIQIWPALWMSECNMFVYDDVPSISLDRQSVLLTSATRPLCVLLCVCVCMCNIEYVIEYVSAILEFCHKMRRIFYSKQNFNINTLTLSLLVLRVLSKDYNKCISKNIIAILSVLGDIINT